MKCSEEPLCLIFINLTTIFIFGIDDDLYILTAMMHGKSAENYCKTLGLTDQALGAGILQAWILSG